MEEVITIRSQILELAERAQREIWKQNPNLWMTERFNEADTFLEWSKYDEKIYNKHKWDGTPDPFLEACKDIRKNKRIGIESATGVGKTYFLARLIYWFLDTHENALVIVTAPTGNQLRRALWGEVQSCFNKFKKLRPHAQIFGDMSLYPEGKGIGVDDDNVKDQYICKGITTRPGADQESAVSFQGSHRKDMLHVVDEAAGVSKAVIKAIVNTSTGTNNPIVLVGNPDNITDALHEFCERKTTKTITVSAMDHPNIVLGVPVIEGAVTIPSIEERSIEYGIESNFYLSRVRGISPKQGTDSLIRMDWILQCTIGDETYTEIDDDESSGNALGVDVANSENGDMACLVWGIKNMLDQVHEFQCTNANHLAYNTILSDWDLESKGYVNYGTSKVYDYKIRAARIGVDSVGVGTSTLQAYHNENWQVVSLMGGQNEDAIKEDYEGRKLYKFASLRAQMYWQLREDLQHRKIKINIIDRGVLNQLTKELVSIKFIQRETAITIEGKENIKKRLGKSPNMADAVVYWNWVRKNRVPDLGGFGVA